MAELSKYHQAYIAQQVDEWVDSSLSGQRSTSNPMRGALDAFWRKFNTDNESSVDIEALQQRAAVSLKKQIATQMINGAATEGDFGALESELTKQQKPKEDFAGTIQGLLHGASMLFGGLIDNITHGFGFVLSFIPGAKDFINNFFDPPTAESKAENAAAGAVKFDSVINVENVRLDVSNAETKYFTAQALSKGLLAVDNQLETADGLDGIKDGRLNLTYFDDGDGTLTIEEIKAKLKDDEAVEAMRAIIVGSNVDLAEDGNSYKIPAQPNIPLSVAAPAANR